MRGDYVKDRISGKRGVLFITAPARSLRKWAKEVVVARQWLASGECRGLETSEYMLYAGMGRK